MWQPALASIVCCVSLASAPAPFRLHVDASAMTRISQLMDQMERDEEPSQAEWDALLATPAYKAMLEGERSRGPLYYINCLRTACKPSMAKEYDRITRSPEEGWEKEVMAKALPHFRKAKERRKEWKAVLLDLERNDPGPRVAELIRPYAPAGGPGGDVTVAFLLFGPDARGFNAVLMDALFYVDLGKERELTLAHELHHVLRGRREALQVNVSEEAIWWLRQILAEGIADRINRAPALDARDDAYGFRNTERGKEYAAHLAKSPDIIRGMDALLQKMADAPDQVEALAGQFQSLIPLSGHLPGYYMASLIEARLGRDRLLEDQVNPATFFALYDEAAAKDGKAPRFSRKSLAYIRHLCRRFEPFKG